ncbi:type III secretion system chaperone [uncultured Shewanella sp.]|uniref:type III secretion system chaperone n=1 Tax=uncultured Shewanella sp. TaxID=173975 RepID=UPI002614739E|nr:type III secretion system chaperone [uncultured Shewanella sp.]
MLKKEFITQFRKEVGISDLNFNEDNLCRLVIDKSIIINIEWIDNKALYLYSVVGISDALTPNQTLSLLHANAYGRGVGENHLAIDEHTNEIIIQHICNLDKLTIKDTISHLENLICFAKVWKRKLLAPPPQSTHNNLSTNKKKQPNLIHI